MGKLANLTSNDNYFEDFEVGQVIRHARGKTMTELENVNITNMVMNTAQGHFNRDQMEKTPLGKILCYGGVNFSLVLGLASQDTVENALAELGLDNIQLKTMVFQFLLKTGLIGDPIHEQHPVEVIHLVLNAARHQTIGLHLSGAAHLIAEAELNRRWTHHVEIDAGDAEAALFIGVEAGAGR